MYEYAGPPFSLRWFIGVRGHSGEATGVRRAMPCLRELRQGTASSTKARSVPRCCDLRLKEEAANPQQIERFHPDIVRGVVPYFEPDQLDDAEHLARRFSAHVDLLTIWEVAQPVT